MSNPYVVILLVSLGGGIATTWWGWHILRHGIRTRRWPTVTGLVEKSETMTHDLLPDIVIRYRIGDETYRLPMRLETGISPSRELVNQYLARFPAGREVAVSYNPEQESDFTLEPGPAAGDWFILLFGILIMLFSGLFLLLGGFF